MKTEKEIQKVLEETNRKKLEKIFNIQIRNGQSIQGLKAALKWVLDENKHFFVEEDIAETTICGMKVKIHGIPATQNRRRKISKKDKVLNVKK